MTFGVKRNSPRRASPGAAADTQSQEALRVRARRRLIGAVALVLLGVIIFPLVFDSRPKPVPANIQLDIPAQSKAPALTVPASAPEVVSASAVAASAGERPQAAEAASAAMPATNPPPPAATQSNGTAVAPASAAPAPAIVAPTKVSSIPERANAPQAVVKSPAADVKHKVPVAPPQPKPAPAAETRAVANARQALAALEGKSPDQISVAQAEAALARKQAAPEDAVPAKTRFVVQAGAFADAHAAQTVRAKIEKAGFKTYTQVVDTAQGKRIRVRVGPFATRDDAERALGKLRRLGLSGAVLTL